MTRDQWIAVTVQRILQGYASHPCSASPACAVEQAIEAANELEKQNVAPWVLYSPKPEGPENDIIKGGI